MYRVQWTTDLNHWDGVRCKDYQTSLQIFTNLSDIKRAEWIDEETGNGYFIEDNGKFMQEGILRNDSK